MPSLRRPDLDPAVQWHPVPYVARNVLRFLPWKDLLQCELVCRAWHECRACSEGWIGVGERSPNFRRWLRNNGSRVICLSIARGDGYKGNPRFCSIDTMLGHLPSPDPEEEEAALQDTCLLLRRLLGAATGLQKLKLSCAALESIPSRIGQLQELNRLTINGCNTVGGLPDTIGQLSSLTSLVIEQCDELWYIPESLGELACLKELHIGNCWQLESLPSSLSSLTALQKLVLDNHNIGDLDEDTFMDMAVLRELNIQQCYAMRKLPRSLVQATALQTLSLLYNHRLKMAWLPGQLHKLKSLRSLSISATNLNFGRLFKGLGKVRSLRTAFINGCKEVKEELPDDVMAPLANHTGLTRLTLNDWRNSALPASIGQATSLKALTLNGCSFKTLPDSLAGLAGSLRTLTVKNCAVRSLPETIGQLTGLRSLLIDHCELLQALPESLGDLTGISDMTVTCCGRLHTLPDSLETLHNLKKSHIYCCEALGL